MDKIPTFSEVCKLMEGKTEVWEFLKPIVKLALLVAPGLVLGVFGAAGATVTSLGTGVTFIDVLETVEGVIIPLKQGLGKKKVDFTGEYEKARIANTLLVFSAYFDTVQQNHPWLWKALELDGTEAQWLTAKAIEDHGSAGELIGSDGRQILVQRSGQMENLMKFYTLLNRRMQSFVTGLERTAGVQVDWGMFPTAAVSNYRKQFVILCQKSTDFLVWTGMQTLEGLLEGQEELADIIRTLLVELRNRQEPDTPNQLHLPPLALLRNRGFVGRKVELETLQQAIIDGDDPILSGPGGIGKTELVAYFGRKVHKDGQTYFVRFRNSFRETVIYGIAQGIPGLVDKKLDEQGIYKAVMDRLRLCEKKDILIIDNVDREGSTFAKLTNEVAYQELRDLPMHLVITTRFEVPRSIKIDSLDNPELYQIFHKHGVELTKQEMDDLINAVGGHTLTVDLMARTLSGGWKPVASQDLLDALRNKTLPDEVYEEIGTDYNRSHEERQIYDHLSIVFNVAGVPENARGVLRCATLLPQNGMSSELFGNALPREFQGTINTLYRHGWLGLKEKKITIHPVIRLVCREELCPNDESCKPFLDALWDQYNNNEYDTSKFFQLAELYSNASDDLQDHLGSWSLRAGKFWGMLGNLKNALKYELRMMEHQESNLPMDHPNLAIAYNNVGMTYGTLGYNDKALEYMMRALSIQEKIIPYDHAVIVMICRNIGMIYDILGDYYKALEYMLKALAIQEKETADQTEVAITYNNVGITYCTLGCYQNAIEYLQKALAIWGKILPHNHPNIATAYSNVGFSYGALGEYQKALEYMLKALEIHKKMLLLDHPALATTYNNVGFFYGVTGDQQKALEYEIKALEIRKKVFPPNHPDIAASYNNLGMTYGALGEYQKALENQLKAKAIHEEVLSPDNPFLANTYNNVGFSYGELGDHYRALEYMLKALAIQEKALSPDHPDIAATYNNVGVTYSALGEYVKALEYIQKALTIWEKKMPDEYQNLATAYSNLSFIHSALEDHNKAHEYELRAKALHEKSLASNKRSVVATLNCIGVTYA